jgi:hypothetical protein
MLQKWNGTGVNVSVNEPLKSLYKREKEDSREKWKE